MTLRFAVLAALTLAAPLGAQQPPAPVPAADEAQQREMQAVQDLLARAGAEFDGPQQGHPP